jgi:hypothetical protein
LHRLGFGEQRGNVDSLEKVSREQYPGLFNALSERDGADSAVKDVFSLSEGKPV